MQKVQNCVFALEASDWSKNQLTNFIGPFLKINEYDWSSLEVVFHPGVWGGRFRTLDYHISAMEFAVCFAAISWHWPALAAVPHGVEF